MEDEATRLRQALGADLAPGDVVAGKYRIERVLRGGGVGVVVEGWHLQLEERVAIKFLRPRAASDEELVARFQREARAAFKIKSEHVTQVMDVGKLDQGVPFIVMEFLDGQDLADVLADRGRVEATIAVDYGIQICRALEAAHALGIVHRDIKPENIFVVRRSGREHIKVLDFGLSKVRPATSGPRRRALTLTGKALGTPQYMAPEQWMSAKDVGPAADLWAVGVILYELLVGVPPFEGEQHGELCRKVLNEPAAALSGRGVQLPANLERIVLRCLAKEPADRFPSAEALRTELLTVVADPERQEAPPPVVSALPRHTVVITDEMRPPGAAEAADMFAAMERKARRLRPGSETIVIRDEDTAQGAGAGAAVGGAPDLARLPAATLVDPGFKTTQPWLGTPPLPASARVRVEPGRDVARVAWAVAAALVILLGGVLIWLLVRTPAAEEPPEILFPEPPASGSAAAPAPSRSAAEPPEPESQPADPSAQASSSSSAGSAEPAPSTEPPEPSALPQQPPKRPPAPDDDMFNRR